MMIQRKVAQAAGAGFISGSDFESFWPSKKEEETETPSWSATPVELRKQILKELRK